MIASFFVGLIVGLIAKFLMPGRDPGGFFVTTLIGIAGALTANMIGTSMGYYNANEAPGWIASIVGSMILLGIYRMILGRKHLTT